MILERHIHELTQRAQSARYNIGHYYFRKINHYKLISICHSHHEQYSRIAFDQETSQMLNSNNHMAFAESLCLFKENQENWYFGFDQQDIKDLDIQYNQFKELKLDNRNQVEFLKKINNFGSSALCVGRFL